jgi:hypothetical protein
MQIIDNEEEHTIPVENLASREDVFINFEIFPKLSASNKVRLFQ